MRRRRVGARRLPDGSTRTQRSSFKRRCLDFSPVAHLLASDDPRLAFGSPADLATAHAVPERVLGDGSTLDQLADAGTHDDHLLWARVAQLVEDLKRIPVDAAALLDERDAKRG